MMGDLPGGPEAAARAVHDGGASPWSGESHLSLDAVAGFLDHMLADIDRARIETHIVHCVRCRDEIVEVARVAHAGRWRTKWSRWARRLRGA